MIMSNLEKTFDKTQHPFMTRTPTKLGIEGKDLNTMKVTGDKTQLALCPVVS
jgi:hypothetical protein